jgi:7-carboxy-7-deazaguanine synthase
MSRTILISEIFGPTIQGEGSLIGRPTVFVRTGGCDYRCDWCDTLYAVLPSHREEWTPTTVSDVLRQVGELSGGRPILVTLSGGNPALQPLEPLLDEGHERGYTFALETQGSVARPWFSKLDYLVLSPKPPSSGMETNWETLRACRDAAVRVDTIMKIVVFDETDYQFARRANMECPGLPVYLQVGNHTPESKLPDGTPDLDGIARRMEWLLDRTLRDDWREVTILPQLHVLLWGNKRGI